MNKIGEYVGFNRLRRDAWVAEKARGLPPGTRILDVGAGPCRYRPLFAHCRYEAQDFAQFTPTDDSYRDWKYGTLDYVCDATAIPVEDGSFDAVLCTEVLEHVPEPIEVIREMARITRPGGAALITAPHLMGAHQEPYHFYGGFTPHFYQRFLSQFGFEIVKLTPNGGLFRLCLQEIHRANHYLIQSKRYSKFHPIRWAVRLVVSRPVAAWLTHLDDAIPQPGFTVGYFVEARKIR